jgi:hypothetical protein
MLIEYPIFLKLVWQYFWQFLISWYWLFLAIILLKYDYGLLWAWHWWRKQTRFLAVQTPKWCEIKLPAGIFKPISAMEMVLENIWKGFWEPPYFWEYWWWGKPPTFDFQFELVSDGGEIHFYLRTFLGYKIDVLKRAVWSQYPEAEIREVEDYSRAIPIDLPRKGWDLRACDFTLARPDAWPINTYPHFEKEVEVTIPTGEERRKIDPMAMLLENLTQIGPGEKIWVQIKPFPYGGKLEQPYIKAAQELKNKIAKRKVEKPKSWLENLSTIITGKRPAESPGKIELVAPELRMTPREREICAEIERKFSKSLFLISTIRFMYFAKREVYNYHRWRQMLDFMGSFSTTDMNDFKVIPHTFTKIVNPPPLNLFDKRRLYVRKRRIIRLYQNRYEPKYPFDGDYRWGYFVLSCEELATVFHFPSRVLAPAPGVTRVEIKKAEAPPEVPMEE